MAETKTFQAMMTCLKNMAAREHGLFSFNLYGNTEAQGPVVQCVVSLTSSLRVILLTVLADSIYNILIFLAEKM